MFIMIVDVPDPPVDITLSSPAAGQIQLNWTSAPINDNKPVVYYVAEYRKRWERKNYIIGILIIFHWVSVFMYVFGTVPTFGYSDFTLRNISAAFWSSI